MEKEIRTQVIRRIVLSRETIDGTDDACEVSSESYQKEVRLRGHNLVLTAEEAIEIAQALVGAAEDLGLKYELKPKPVPPRNDPNEYL